MSFLGSLGKGLLKGFGSMISNVPIIGDIAGFLLDDYERSSFSREQVGTSKDLMNYQNMLNLSNWQTQMGFNNFANDLQHMKSAGINPLDYGGSSPTAAVSGVSGASAPDISSLLNYQMSMKLNKLQLENLREDNKIKSADARAAQAEADARIAEAKTREADAKADLKFGDRVITSRPDDDHDWQVDQAGYWYYLDENNNMVYAESEGDENTQRDILRETRYRRELDEAETVRFNKFMAEYNQRIRTIEAVIAEEFGISMASEQLHQLLANIANIEARTNMTNAQKYQLELDNEIWSHLGADGRAAVKILQYVLGFIKH